MEGFQAAGRGTYAVALEPGGGGWGSGGLGFGVSLRSGFGLRSFLGRGGGGRGRGGRCRIGGASIRAALPSFCTHHKSPKRPVTSKRLNPPNPKP